MCLHSKLLKCIAIAIPRHYSSNTFHSVCAERNHRNRMQNIIYLYFTCLAFFYIDMYDSHQFTSIINMRNIEKFIREIVFTQVLNLK